MSKIKVDCRNENCPVPLVEMRKALKKADVGDIVEITGDHRASLKEIPMAVEALGYELLEVFQDDGYWVIKIMKS